MFYKIENPSDSMTIEADEDLVAALAGVYLGQGNIGVTSESGEDVLPLFVLGGDEALIEWLKTVDIDGIDGLKDALLGKKDEIAACLESIVYGGIAERKWIAKTLKDHKDTNRLRAIYEWNDMKRSSMNDYAKTGFLLAKQIRELEEKDIPSEDKAEA